MARLNEMSSSSDSLETLRKKMLRQNRDLAKSNNIRALRIRELENDCACMLSENLELRGRILELEKQAEDNEARRIADHAMAIKAKLESQLTEWGTLIAGLGLEPPMKRHSPVIRRTVKQRMSFSASRPSPSQRRLRDIARDIEELGHISENKSYPRKSMNPEQILALRSEVDFSVESPELGPPPMSKFIDDDFVKVDSPSRAPSERCYEQQQQQQQQQQQSPARTPRARLEPPSMALSSPKADDENATTSSPEKKVEPTALTNEQADQVENTVEAPTVQPIKAGSKRKLAARDDAEPVQPRRITNESDLTRAVAERTLLREKAGGKATKEPASMRKDAQEKQELSAIFRRPLTAKSTNDDINSPRKNPKAKASTVDDVAATKANAAKTKSANDRSKSKSKTPLPIMVETVPVPDAEPPATATVVCDLAVPDQEPALLLPNSPELATTLEGPRGDTPPPADISSGGETSRPSRRNRAAISYAEPNLRDKMRRPTKELFDAVAGEGKHPRRTSQSDSIVLEPTKVTRESDADETLRQMPVMPDALPAKPELDSVPGSPLAGKGLAPENLPNTVVMERRKRSSNVVPKTLEAAADGATRREAENTSDASASLDSSELGEVDIYEFTSSSPQPDKEETKESKRSSRRQTTSSRRSSATVEDDSGLTAKERNCSRRRSMMV